LNSYYNLGSYSRSVTTSSVEAQTWFDRGLMWSFGYNHEEALRCFEKAAKANPRCAMAQWGIAYAAGPNYNKQWSAFDASDLRNSPALARRATELALALIDGASPVEKALIRPLAKRYPSADWAQVTPVWNDNCAEAMRHTYRAFPSHHDVVALFAEAIMNRTPCLLWDIKRSTAANAAEPSAQPVH
jgi:hypothetical protein